MSTLEVNNIKDTGSNSLISSDGSGTFTINNGVLKMTPAFTARITASSQSIGDSVDTKVQCDDEMWILMDVMTTQQITDLLPQ